MRNQALRCIPRAFYTGCGRVLELDILHCIYHDHYVEVSELMWPLGGGVKPCFMIAIIDEDIGREGLKVNSVENISIRGQRCWLACQENGKVAQ